MGMLDKLKAVGAEILGKTEQGIKLRLPKDIASGSNVAREITIPHHMIAGDEFGDILHLDRAEDLVPHGKVSAPDMKSTQDVGTVINPRGDKSIAEQLMEKRQYNEQKAKFREEGFDPNKTIDTSELALEPKGKVSVAGVDKPNWQKGADDMFDSSAKRMAGMSAGLGAGQSFDNPLSTMKEGYDSYKKIKDMLTEKAASNMNFGKDPTFQKVAEGAIGVAGDPLNLVEGPAGLGLGALQAGLEALPEDNRFKKTKKLLGE
jgi:hypothetical protein